MHLTFCVILCVVAYFVFELIKWYRRKIILSKIPSPDFNRWDFLQLLSTPDVLFEKFRDFGQRFYPIYRLSSLQVSVVALLDPDDVQQVLCSTKNIRKSRIYSMLENWLGTGLLTSYGRKWQARRKILTPAFHFNILQEFVQVFNDEAQKLVRCLSKASNHIDVVPYVTQFTLQSILDTAMGCEAVSVDQQKRYKREVHQMGKILLKKVTSPLNFIRTYYRFTKLSNEEDKSVNVMHLFSRSVIESREKHRTLSATKRKRFLDILLDAKYNGEDIDDAGIREEVDTLMFEGHDTISMALSMILYVLSNHQIVQDCIHQEIVQIVGHHQSPNYHQLQDLKYMERCIKECLRLYPSVPFISRILDEDIVTKSGYLIPSGTIVHLHIFDIHRNEQFFPDPLAFNPDRFMLDECKNRHPFVYVPFSAGPRNCIGQRFAMLEIKAALCSIISQLRIVPVKQKIAFQMDLLLRPKDGIFVSFVSRK